MEVETIGDIGVAVRLARKELRLTQVQAAALCGVSMPFLNQLEGGKRANLSMSMTSRMEKQSRKPNA